MSRIDDDHSERRIEEARNADRRAQERVKKEKTEQGSAFDRAMAQRAGEQVAQKTLREAPEKPKAPPPDAKQDARPKEGARQPPPAAKGAQRGAEQVETQGQADRADSQRRTERQGVQPRAGQASADKSPLGAARADARSPADLKDAQSDRGTGGKGEEGKETAASSGKKGNAVKRADDDDRGNKDQRGNSKDQQPAAFRLPMAALMAPPPVARPKDAGGARLSSLTKEIVDKIVSRVLVGTNSQGVPEFRLDLKSSVLKGLSIRVSGRRGGKIRAVFSGSDREVLEGLKANSSDLVDALASKGLTLEDLVFEENA